MEDGREPPSRARHAAGGVTLAFDSVKDSGGSGGGGEVPVADEDGIEEEKEN